MLGACDASQIAQDRVWVALAQFRLQILPSMDPGIVSNSGTYGLDLRN